MKSFGEELPDCPVRISDDAQAKRLLLALGILDELPSKDALRNSGRAEIDTVAVPFLDHPTHWILAFRFHGNELPEDNGFLVCAWPKNQYPRTVIEAALEREQFGPPDAVKPSTSPSAN